MDLIDLESVASVALKACCLDSYDPPKLQDLLKSIGISLEIYKGLRTQACLSKVNGEHKIWLKRHYNKTTARYNPVAIFIIFILSEMSFMRAL